MGSFPYENPFGFGEAWGASYFMIRRWQANPSAPVSSAHETISLLKASAFRKHRSFGSPIGLFMASDNLMEA